MSVYPKYIEDVTMYVLNVCIFTINCINSMGENHLNNVITSKGWTISVFVFVTFSYHFFLSKSFIIN